MPSGIVYMTPGDLLTKLEEMAARGQHPGDVMAVISEMLVARVSDEYETAGHGKWKKLAASTIARRRKKGLGAQILKNTGIAAGSTRQEHTDTSAEAATEVEYLIYHVSDAPRSIIPLRNPFDIPDEVFDEATDLLLAFVVG